MSSTCSSNLVVVVAAVAAAAAVVVVVVTLAETSSRAASPCAARLGDEAAEAEQGELKWVLAAIHAHAKRVCQHLAVPTNFGFTVQQTAYSKKCRADRDPAG